MPRGIALGLHALGVGKKPGGGGSWWDGGGLIGCCIAAWAATGAADYASSKLDLTGNGNHLTEGVAPSWDAVGGWGFNGSTQHLLTGLTPAGDQSWSAIVSFHMGGVGYLTGSRNAGGEFFGLMCQTGANLVLYRNGGGVTVAPNLAAGTLTVAGSQGYRNGVAEGGAIASWVGTPTACALGCYLNAGFPTGYYLGAIKAAAYYNCILTPVQVLAVHNLISVL